MDDGDKRLRGTVPNVPSLEYEVSGKVMTIRPNGCECVSVSDGWVTVGCPLHDTPEQRRIMNTFEIR